MLQRLKDYLLLWGLPGLLAIALFDSAGVPMMGGPDAVVLLLAWQRPADILVIILAAAVGSTAGCLILYNVGRAGGEVALSRFSTDRKERIKQKLDRNAFAALVTAVVLPPPFPMKLAILAAGALRVRQMKFVYGVLTGRLLRYAVMAVLGAKFGNQAAGVLKEHYPVITLVLIAFVTGLFLLRRYRKRHK